MADSRFYNQSPPFLTFYTIYEVIFLKNNAINNNFWYHNKNGSKKIGIL